MRGINFIVVFCLIQFSCSRGTDSMDLDYVKVVILKEADSLTSFNKGVGLGEYAYIDIKKGSFICRNWIDSGIYLNLKPQIVYSTYTGQIKDTSEISAILKLIRLAQRYPSGDINSSSLYKGAIYCGPEYYLEFKNDRGLHYYTFILDGNDTIEKFDSSFTHFSEFSRNFQKTDNRRLNGDSIAVATLEVFGIYNKMEAPYVPFACEDQIEFDKLAGTWRTLSNLAYPGRSTYAKVKFLSDGTCTYEFVRKGISDSKLVTARYQMDRKSNKIFIITKSSRTILKIIKLTDFCLVLEDEQRNDTVRYDRM